MQPNTEITTSEIEIVFNHPKFGQRKTMVYGHQMLGEYRTALDMSSETYLFINYYFEYKGTRLNQSELFSNLIHDKKARIDIVFIPFEYRSARHHLYTVMEVVFNPELYLYLQKSVLKNNQVEDSNRIISQSRAIPTTTSGIDVESIGVDLNSEFLVAESQIDRKVNLLISLSLSGFNPPPTSERLNGDLFYIHAHTLEDQDLHISACPSGFYINQSKISSFNPHKSTVYKQTYGSLIDLFKNVSEKFRQNLELFLNETKLTEAMKYKFYSFERIRKDHWLESPQQYHGWNQRKNSVDQYIKLQLISLKDWNEVFQGEVKWAKSSNEQPIQKSANLSKIYSQFQKAAIEGATCLIDGKISALNPTDQKKKHIYIYNKIFFSIANETIYDHYQEKGQDATPSSSSINTDIINIEILYELGIPELHILHMISINYRGFRVIAQCIIPGILSIDLINCSQYGSIDDGKTIQTNPQFQKMMIQVCQKLGLQDNIQVIDAQGVKKRSAGSPDIKGILGTDKKKYILDLQRLSPRDLNYQGPKNQTCVIRPELLKNFKKYKGNEVLPKLNVNIGTELKFTKSQKYEQQLNLLKEIAAYLKNNAINSLIDLFKNHPSQYLTNNQGVTCAFHMMGVNMRYLGEVYHHEGIRNQVQIKLVLERVMVVRSIKHCLRMAMRESSLMHLGATIINILNCIFGKKCHILHLEQGSVEAQEIHDKNHEKDNKKKKKKKNKQTNQTLTQSEFNQIVNVIKIPVNRFLVMKPGEVWSQVCKIAKARFNYEFPKSQLEVESFRFPFQKLAALREVCLCVGLVLQRKNYDIFDGLSSPSATNPNQKILPFSCRNILDMVPLAKHMHIQPQNLIDRQKQSQKLIEKYQVKEALKMDSSLQKQNMIICGGLNDTGIKIFSRMGRILYILGQNRAAISQQQKNLCMLQSLHCQDNWLNIQTHINLGLYYITSNDKNRVIYYIIKGIYLMLVAFGETSPDLLVSFANLARIYQINKQHKEAIKCYKVAMKFIEQVHGKYHVKMSFCYTSLATIYYQIGDIKTAIEYQTENVAILNKILPENDMKYLDAVKILKMYGELWQKEEIKKKGKKV